MSQYTTGEMAKACGVTVRTVQFYDQKGILIPSALSEGGRRLYSEDDLRRWICEKLTPELPYLYIYTGDGDELEHKFFVSVESTYDILTEVYPPELMTEIILPEQKHHEAAWEPVFRDFLHTFLNK